MAAGGGASGRLEQAGAALELVAAPLRQAVEVLARHLQERLELHVREVPLQQAATPPLTHVPTRKKRNSTQN